MPISDFFLKKKSLLMTFPLDELGHIFGPGLGLKGRLCFFNEKIVKINVLGGGPFSNLFHMNSSNSSPTGQPLPLDLKMLFKVFHLLITTSLDLI